MCYPKRENVLKMNWGFVNKKELMQYKVSQFLILCKTESYTQTEEEDEKLKFSRPDGRPP